MNISGDIIPLLRGCLSYLIVASPTFLGLGKICVLLWPDGVTDADFLFYSVLRNLLLI